jgi:hypothetical protein
MNWILCSGFMLMLFFSAALAVDEVDPLGSATGDEIASTNSQDLLGNATPVITGKNLPGSMAEQQPTQPQARLLSPNSNWSLSLIDNLDRSVVISMFQSNNVLFGKGTISAAGSMQEISATGTIDGNKASLDVLSDDMTLFRISLTMNGKSLSGDYHGYSASYVPWKGIAMGKIN